MKPDWNYQNFEAGRGPIISSQTCLHTILKVFAPLVKDPLVPETAFLAPTDFLHCWAHVYSATWMSHHRWLGQACDRLMAMVCVLHNFKFQGDFSVAPCWMRMGYVTMSLLLILNCPNFPSYLEGTFSRIQCTFPGHLLVSSIVIQLSSGSERK